MNGIKLIFLAIFFVHHICQSAAHKSLPCCFFFKKNKQHNLKLPENQLKEPLPKITSIANLNDFQDEQFSDIRAEKLDVPGFFQDEVTIDLAQQEEQRWILLEQHDYLGYYAHFSGIIRSQVESWINQEDNQDLKEELKNNGLYTIFALLRLKDTDRKLVLPATCKVELDRCLQYYQQQAREQKCDLVNIWNIFKQTLAISFVTELQDMSEKKYVRMHYDLDDDQVEQ